TVLAAPTPTCSFYISPTGDLCADGRISLRVVSTDGTPSSYAWSTGETIGRILVYSSGYYSVTVNYTNECSKTQSIYIDPPTGSGCLFYLKAEPLKFLQTTEYPNPVDGELSVEVDNNLLVGSDEVQIALIDQSGRVAFSSNFKTEFNKIKINTSNMPSGLYLLQIGTTKTGVVRKKIMVTH
ncbi:MAG TPA: T9SS type A sorting domain-containing protein, partial [Cyclobacteriaceae bacterium]|nr:T9SS type A sorting domain-containing protein [Cyclobacteriaceae bacterium]